MLFAAALGSCISLRFHSCSIQSESHNRPGQLNYSERDRRPKKNGVPRAVHLRNIVASLRNKVIPEAEDETAKHRQREQQPPDFDFATKKEDSAHQRRQSYDDDDVDVPERVERYHRRLMCPTVTRGNDEMDQD